MKPEVIRSISGLQARTPPRGGERDFPSAWCRPWARCTPAIWRWSTLPNGSPIGSSSRFSSTRRSSRRPKTSAPIRATKKPTGTCSRSARRRRPLRAIDSEKCIRRASTRPSWSADPRRGWRPISGRTSSRGVATVVAKLLLAGLPDRAFFGEKDFQQLLVVKQLVRDLNIPTEIVGCPTVREPDGLALSSRNAYLTSSERARSATPSRDTAARGIRDQTRPARRGGPRPWPQLSRCCGLRGRLP